MEDNALGASLEYDNSPKPNPFGDLGSAQAPISFPPKISEPEARPAEPSWSEQIGQMGADLLHRVRAGLTGDDSEPTRGSEEADRENSFSQRTQTAAGLVPGLSNALSANEAKRDWDRKDYIGAGINSLGIIPAPPGIRNVAREATPAAEALAQTLARQIREHVVATNVSVPTELANRNYTIHWVDPQAMDQAWQAGSPLTYVPSGVPDRRLQVAQEQLRTVDPNTPIEAPAFGYVNTGSGRAAIPTANRHTFAAMRDDGFSAIPVAMTDQSAVYARMHRLLVPDPREAMEQRANEARERLSALPPPASVPPPPTLSYLSAGRIRNRAASQNSVPLITQMQSALGLNREAQAPRSVSDARMAARTRPDETPPPSSTSRPIRTPPRPVDYSAPTTIPTPGEITFSARVAPYRNVQEFEARNGINSAKTMAQALAGKFLKTRDGIASGVEQNRDSTFVKTRVDLYKPGTSTKISSTPLERTIFPSESRVHHDYMILASPYRGGGTSQYLLARQISNYQRWGLDKVDVIAALDNGGYTWLKYGFFPKGAQSLMLAENASQRWSRVRSAFPADKWEGVQRVLDGVTSNGKDMWKVADINLPLPPGIAQDPLQNTVGKYLLSGVAWSGDLFLREEESMRRFWKYIHHGLNRQAR